MAPSSPATVHGGSVTSTASNALTGGLVSAMYATAGSIIASYSTASVSATGTGANAAVGGLLGRQSGGRVIASYAAGPISVTGDTTYIGGVVGRSTNNSPVTDSHCSASAHPPGNPAA